MELPNAYVKTPIDNLALLFKKIKIKSRQYTVTNKRIKFKVVIK